MLAQKALPKKYFHIYTPVMGLRRRAEKTLADVSEASENVVVTTQVASVALIAVAAVAVVALALALAALDRP